jgi:multiple sugar transport system permease protein
MGCGNIRRIPLMAMKGIKFKREKVDKAVFIVLFLLVPVTLLIVFTYLPTANMLYWSFTSWNGISPSKTLVGFANYVRIFTDPSYFQPLVNSLYYLAGTVIQIILAMFFAVILVFITKFSGFFKGILFFPYLLNGVTAGLMFQMFFKPAGTLDSVLGIFGYGGGTNWLEQGIGTNVILGAVSVWRYTGFNLVMFLGVIQSIPTEQFEAADLDGATMLQKFRYIILPGIKLVVMINLILAVKGALSVFEVPYIITGGSFGTSTFVIRVIETGIQTPRAVGRASAMSVILLVFILIATFVQKAFFKDDKA